MTIHCVEFTVWNWKEERYATEEEIKEHVYIVYRNGKCFIEEDLEYSLCFE